MVHIHGAQAQQLAEPIRGLDPAELVAVPVDVGKRAAVALVCDFTSELLARPFAFPMTMAGCGYWSSESRRLPAAERSS
jgi:hypothetical protein